MNGAPGFEAGVGKGEREMVLGPLASSEARLLELVEGLTPAQWNFREAPERWSIAEKIEHCIVFENFIMSVVAKALDGVAEPEKKADVAGKEPLVMGLAEARDVKFMAREAT